MSFPPDVYLIGAQKAGTTTLAYLLSQHPDFCVSEPKEPHFFTRNGYKGLAWYQERFANPHAICIDASVTNSQALLSENLNSSNAAKCLQGVPKRVYSLNPNAKFIYLLREPVERTYSAYWFRVELDFESRSFADALHADSVYIDTSDYYGQLCLWLEYFPIESFLFLLFDDLKKKPIQVVKKCCDFLKVDFNQPIQLEIKNQSTHYTYVGRKINKAFYDLDKRKVGFLAPKFVRKITQALTKSYSGFPPIPQAEQFWLQEYFADKNSKLEQITGLSLNKWCDNKPRLNQLPNLVDTINNNSDRLLLY